MNNPAASGGESDPEEIEALEPPLCAPGADLSEGFKGTVPRRAKRFRFFAASNESQGPPFSFSRTKRGPNRP